MTLFAHSFQLLTKDVVDATTTTRYYYLSGASFHVLFEDFVERVKRRVRMVSLSERESERERGPFRILVRSWTQVKLMLMLTLRSV